MEDPSNQTITLSETTAPADAGINKRFLKPLRIILLILAVVFAVLLYFSFISRPYDKTCNTFSNIRVNEDDDLKAVSSQLEDKGIVSDADKFSIVARLAFLTEFKPGTYYLAPSMNSIEIARTMVNGLTTNNGFTIPAGYSLEQTASALARDGFVDKDAFIKAASDKSLQDLDFIGKDVKGPEQVEGFLFPGDYAVDPTADESMMILTMLDGFSNFFNEDYRARADELEMSIRDIIIIASMIERETSIDREMPEMSAVIHNRINLEMTRRKEIPAIPLCSPGEEAITAALYPTESENTYYVMSADLDGSHVFTSDKKEYRRLVDEYNEALRARDAYRHSNDIDADEVNDKSDTAADSD